MVAFPHNPLQPNVSSFFKTALETNSISHAYLFVGSHPETQLEMARNLAAALIESDRSLIDAGTHPDVREYKPAATVGYLSEQIAELINDVQLSPSRAKRKVFIVQDAQALTDKTANALLKTLEEPPLDVTFLLLAQSEATVLPTIVSRAQLIRFRHEDEEELVSSLIQRMGDYSRPQIISALHIASSPQAAQDLLSNTSAWRAQKMLFETIATLPTFTTWQLLQKAQGILAMLEANNAQNSKHSNVQSSAGSTRAQDESNSGTRCTKAVQEKERQAADQSAHQTAIEKEFLSTKALKELEKSQKRAEKAASQEAVEQLVVAAELFLRDVVALEVGVDETTLALPDTLETTRQACRNWGSAQALHGITIVQAARDYIRHNVTPRLALEAMLCYMEDELCQK